MDFLLESLAGYCEMVPLISKFLQTERSWIDEGGGGGE